jgi:hypothetical protein
MKVTSNVIWENREGNYHLECREKGSKCLVHVKLPEELTLQAVRDLKDDLEEVIATMSRGD